MIKLDFISAEPIKTIKLYYEYVGIEILWI